MTDESRDGAAELVIAVYLDTNVLLDLLAAVEDGFSLVERVTSGQTSGTTSERSGTADFGAPGVFSMFKLSGKLGKSRNQGTSETTEAELTHTYGSLLHRLRRYLFEEGLVTSMVDDDQELGVGSFIEFTGVVRPNPFTASFHQLQRMLSFMDVVMAIETKPQARSGGVKPNRGQNQPRHRPANPQAAQMNAMSDFFEKLTADVEREGTSTVVIEGQVSNYTALATIFDDFLRDRSMAELLNREFRVLGKVARHLLSGSSEKVDLLASSGVAGFPPQVLESLSEMLGQMSDAGVAQLATPTTTIDPPLVEIIPIAIYL